jgi:hypothetical protein
MTSGSLCSAPSVPLQGHRGVIELVSFAPSECIHLDSRSKSPAVSQNRRLHIQSYQECANSESSCHQLMQMMSHSTVYQFDELHPNESPSTGHSDPTTKKTRQVAMEYHVLSQDNTKVPEVPDHNSDQLTIRKNSAASVKSIEIPSPR